MEEIPACGTHLLCRDFDVSPFGRKSTDGLLMKGCYDQVTLLTSCCALRSRRSRCSTVTENPMTHDKQHHLVDEKILGTLRAFKVI